MFKLGWTKAVRLNLWVKQQNLSKISALTTLVTMSCTHTLASTNSGDLLLGTVIVIMPCNKGVIVAADRLLTSKTRSGVQTADKVLLANEAFAIASHGAPRVVGYKVDDSSDILFDANKTASNFLSTQQRDKAQNLSDAQVVSLAQLLFNERNRALQLLPNGRDLELLNTIERPVLTTLIVHFPITRKPAEVVEIEIYRAESADRNKALREDVLGARVYGEAQPLSDYMNKNAQSDVAKAISKADFTADWSEGKALKLVSKMIAITHKTSSSTVGQEFDALLISSNGKSKWIARNLKSNAEGND